MAGVRQFDHEKVLTAVLDVFWRKGWLSTSMADLAEASGVQRGSLYNAYGGKEELFLLAFELYAQSFLAEARKALDAPTAAKALKRLFAVAIRNMSTGDPPRGCLTTKTAAELDGAGLQIQQRLRDLLADLNEIVQSALAAKHFTAELRVPPDDTARIIVTFTRGLAVMELLYHDPDELQATADALVQTLLVSSDALRQ